MPALIRDDQSNPAPSQIENARNPQGTGVNAHPAMETQQRYAVADVPVREARAVDLSDRRRD
jgi:hypothetical protein